MMKLSKKLFSIIALTLAFSIALIGCSSENTSSNTENEETEVYQNYIDDSYIVNANWLSENLGNENLLILDARGENEYNKGHIPGAVSVTWQQFSNMKGKPGEKGWGVVLDKENLSQKLSEIGVTKDKTIVVYCDTKNGWGEDGRIVWMLRMVGLDNSKMLNGGFGYWKDNNYEVSKDPVTPKVSDFKVENINRDVTINTEVLKNKLSEIKIIDTRSEDEYKGAAKYGEARGGHIPNAILISHKELLNEDGTLKNASNLEKIFKTAGLKKDDEIVTYCTAGIRSAYVQVVLKMMGYNNVKNYDESFYAWANDKNLKLDEKSAQKIDYKYYSAEKLKEAIESEKSVLIVDIQVEEEFNKHHIKGAIPTYAYPVKSDTDKVKIDGILEKLENSKDDIVIICPRGKGGAERTYGYLLEKGIDSSRIYILKDGQAGWPYKELLEK